VVTYTAGSIPVNPRLKDCRARPAWRAYKEHALIRANTNDLPAATIRSGRAVGRRCG
jgi:hypothetical protein